MKRLHLMLSLLFAVLLLQPAAAQQGERMRGTVLGVAGGLLTMRADDGRQIVAKLPETVSVAAFVPASVSGIKPGDFVGVGARPQADGTLRAIQVFIFPEAMRGRGEGHRPWSALPETTMTNATVESAVSDVEGPMLSLAYKGGKQRIFIPDDANVITLAPAMVDDLSPGDTVIVDATHAADDTWTASRISFPKNGAKLPL